MDVCSIAPLPAHNVAPTVSRMFANLALVSAGKSAPAGDLVV